VTLGGVATRHGGLLSRDRNLKSAYAPDVMAGINAHGGLKRDFIRMRAPDTYRYFSKC
jgi:hypothetical protein